MISTRRLYSSVLRCARSGAVCAVLAAALAPVASGAEFVAKRDGDSITVTLDGKIFTAYKFAPNLKKPYLWPVAGPASGASLTIESHATQYPHHNSLWFGCDRVNGGNYWQDENERGQILSQGPRIVEGAGQRIVLEDVCLWKQPGKEAILRDVRRITITAPSAEQRFIDFDITLIALTGITIEKSNHALFSARMVPELSVNAGGVLINAHGGTAEKGTFAKPSPWCDYAGARGGVKEGLAILEHPENRWAPSPWFTRDYGFFSPTPMNWLEDGPMRIAKGERVTLRYRVIAHTGDALEAEIAKRFEEYVAEPLSEAPGKLESGLEL